MIFLGDIASPDIYTSEQLGKALSEQNGIFNNKRLICNFEGLISDRLITSDKNPILFNHEAVTDELNRGYPPVLCLANNHTLDLPDYFDSTLEILTSKGISFCGAGKSVYEASKPVLFDEGKGQVLLFNACWNFLLYNHSNPSKGVYVAEINEARILHAVREQKNLNRNASIVVFLHWSFDLEILPFPMYRQFSRDLIDAGANIVVGTHSHCPQGGEKYKDGFIVYGLGNFFLPYKTFIGGDLTFPDFARIEMALEWDPFTNKAICHWFEYKNNHNMHWLKLISSEKFEDSVRLEEYSPYINMSGLEYLKYYKSHRRKRIMIPTFQNYKLVFRNNFFTNYLKIRARLARLLTKLKLRNWQN